MAPGASATQQQETVESRRSKRKQERSQGRNNPVAKKPKTAKRNQPNGQGTTRERGGSVKTRNRRQTSLENEASRIDEEDPEYKGGVDVRTSGRGTSGRGTLDRFTATGKQTRSKHASGRGNGDEDQEDHQLQSASAELEKIREKITGKEFGLISKAIQQSQQIGRTGPVEGRNVDSVEDRANGLEGHDLDDEFDAPQDGHEQVTARGGDSEIEDDEDDDDVLEINTPRVPQDTEEQDAPDTNPPDCTPEDDDTVIDVETSADRSTECQSAAIGNSSIQVSELDQGNAISSGPITTPQGSIDESMLLNALKSLHTQTHGMLKSELKSVVSEVHGEFESLRQLKDTVMDLNSSVLTLARMMINRQMSAVMKQNLQVEQALSVLPELFNEKVICTVLTKCFVVHCYNAIKDDGMSNSTSIGAIFLKMINFSILPSDRKREKFQSTVGKEFSLFRHGVLLSAILALQTNAFNTFLTEKEAEASNTLKITEPLRRHRLTDKEPSCEMGVLGLRSTQPRWLKVGYISVAHCDEAATKAESRKAEEPSRTTDTDSCAGSVRSTESDGRSPKPSAPANNRPRNKKTASELRHLIGVEAASQIYRLITSHLHKARDACKLQLFHDVLYVFTGWSQHQKRIDQRSLRLAWMDTTTHSFLDSRADIPRMTEVRVQDRYETETIETEEVNSANLKLVSEFISKHPDMTLVVTHDVIVKGTVQSLRYYVSILDVAAKLVSAFGSLDSNSRAKDILSVYSESFKVIHVIAHTLRSLIDLTMKEVNHDGTVQWADSVAKKKKVSKKRGTPSEDCTDNVPKNYKYPILNGISIEDYLPAPSTQKNVLETMLLSLKEGEFHNKNRSTTSRDGRPVTDVVHMDVDGPEQAIQVDESIGVVQF